eukprot:s616_g19.t5
MAIGRISNWASDLFFPVEGREGSRPGSQERRSHETLAARISQAGRQVLEADRSNEGWTFVAPSPAPLLSREPGRPKFDRVSAPEVEHGLVRPLRYVENRGSAQRVADAFRNGKVVLLEHEFDPKPWKSQMFSAMTDATSFLVAARYYMKLDPQTKKDAWGWWEFFRPSACGLEAEVVELPGKECVHLSKEMVERLGECAARAAWRGFDCLARGLLLTLQAAEPSFEPDVYGDDQGHFTAGAGVYRDKLKPLLDSTDAGHLLSIFSYTGEGACIEHVDRGFITLVTNTDGALQVQDSQSRWLDVPQTNGLVAFAGKTLEFLTQGKYPAVPHRIAPGKATGRVSLAFKLRAPLAAELVLRNGDVTTVGQLFESHVDALGLSINQPSTAIASTATAGAVSSSVARGHQGHHGPRGGYGEAEAERGAKLANSAGAVTVVPLFQSCELPAFLACRAVCREWLGYSDMSQCWVRFCIQRGIPWLHRQLDWPGYFSDWQKKLYIWRHQPKIRAVAIQSPFAMYSNVRPRPPVCRSQRFSAAIRQWGMAGHCEVKFYRPDEGRKTECLGVWDGVLLRQSHLQENIDEVEFSRHGGTTWDPFLGELNLSDQILFHIARTPQTLPAISVAAKKARSRKRQALTFEDGHHGHGSHGGHGGHGLTAESSKTDLPNDWHAGQDMSLLSVLQKRHQTLPSAEIGGAPEPGEVKSPRRFQGRRSLTTGPARLSGGRTVPKMSVKQFLELLEATENPRPNSSGRPGEDPKRQEYVLLENLVPPGAHVSVAKVRGAEDQKEVVLKTIRKGWFVTLVPFATVHHYEDDDDEVPRRPQIQAPRDREQSRLSRSIWWPGAVVAAVAVAVCLSIWQLSSQTNHSGGAEAHHGDLQEKQEVPPPGSQGGTLEVGPGCPSACGSFVACTLSETLQNQGFFPLNPNIEPIISLTRLFNKQITPFVPEFQCPDTEFAFVGDDFCDCPVTCADETGANEITCLGAGTGQIFECPGTLCQISAGFLNDGRCDCPDTCADEDFWDCSNCSCPSICGVAVYGCDGSGVFECPLTTNNQSCNLPGEREGDGICDCPETCGSAQHD